jgi:hypothetical protein
VELAGVGRGGEIPGKESDADWNPAAELPSSRGYFYETPDLHRHAIPQCMNHA